MKKVRVSNRCHDTENPGFVEAQNRGFEKSLVILAVREGDKLTGHYLLRNQGRGHPISNRGVLLG